MKRAVIASIELLDIDNDRCMIRVLNDGNWETCVMRIGECMRFHSITVEPNELVAINDEYDRAILKAKS